MRQSIAALIIAITVAPAAFGQEDINWLSGKWETGNGAVSMALKVHQGKVEGQITTPSLGGPRPVTGEIKNFAVDGDKVTFEADFDYGPRSTPPGIQTSRFAFKVVDQSRMEGTRTFPDGQSRRQILEKKK